MHQLYIVYFVNKLWKIYEIDCIHKLIYSKQIDGNNLMRMLDSQEGLFPRKLHLLVQVIPNRQKG